jgi:hypothetical protein
MKADPAGMSNSSLDRTRPDRPSPGEEAGQAEGCAGSGEADGEDEGTVRWVIGRNQSGGLTATLSGFEPPNMISASDLPALRKRIAETILRGLL